MKLHVALCWSVSAVAVCTAPLLAQSIPQASSVQLDALKARELKDIPYVKNGTERQRLDLFLPANATASSRPLVVWVHGGGWQAGSKADCPARWLVTRGYAVASIGYRLSQTAKFPAQIEDCKAAIRWLRAHAKEYGIDASHVGAWGASAGGHLVSLLGTTGGKGAFDEGENLDQSSAVNCVVDWFGPTDFLHYGDPAWTQLDTPESAVSQLIGGTVSSHQEQAKLASPVTYVDAKSAPFLIMQGDKDGLVPLQQSELLNTALSKAGVPSTLKVIGGAGHGGKQFFSIDNIAAIATFFDRYLGSSTPAAGLH
jgi:acetyl esterase/lipase